MKYYFYVLLFLITAISRAQQPYLPHFTTENGLPGNTIYKVVRDERDFLWIATNNGICRFDGQKFKTFSLKGLVNDVEFIDIYMGKHGRIWFIPFSGDVLLYDGLQFKTASSFFERTFSKVHQIFEDDFGFIWIMQADGTIFRFNTATRQTTYIRDSSPRYHNATIVAIPKPNIIWLNNGTDVVEVGSNKTIFKLNKSHSYGVSFRPRITKKLPDKRLIYTTDQDVSIYGQNQVAIVEKGTLPYSQISFIENGTNQNIYVGTTTKGLFEYQLQAEKLVFKQNILPNESITFCTNDHEGNLWIGTYSGGLYCMPQQQSYQLNEWQYQKAELLCLAKNKNNVLAGFNNGTFATKDGTFGPSKLKKYDTRSFTDGAAITSRVKRIRNLNGASWIIHDNTLLKLDGDKVMMAGGLGANLKDITQVDSLLLIATHSGIRCATERQLRTSMNAFKGNKKNAIEMSKSLNIFNSRATTVTYAPRTKLCWIGLVNGLACLKKADIEVWHKNHNYLTINSLPSSPLPAALQNFTYRISSLASLPDGSLVIGTTVAGIFILKDDKRYNISIDEGLSDNFCQNLFVDSAGTLWVSTVNGLNKIKIQDISAKKYSISIINQSQGLLSNIINDVVVQNDSVWVATPNGITFLTDNSDAKNTTIPVRITTVMADGKIVEWQNKQEIWQENELKIDFGAISYQQRNNLSYRYRLVSKGLFASQPYRNWVSTTEPSISFKNLLPGDYSLDIEAISKDSGRRIGKLSSPLNINVLWYKNWFLLYILFSLAILGLVSLAFAYYFQRERRKRAYIEQFNELEKQAFQAQMNPHFVFNCLNAIQEFLVSNEPEQAQRYLSQFAKLIRKTLDFTKRSTVTLADEVEFLKLYVRLEQLRFEDPFRFEINVGSDINSNEIDIPPLLLQPFIENAIKHGQLGRLHHEGLLKIDFSILDDELTCVIDDNGIGLEQSKILKSQREIAHTSHGLGIVEKRMLLLNQFSKGKNSFVVLDKKDSDVLLRGTQVIIKLHIS